MFALFILFSITDKSIARQEPFFEIHIHLKKVQNMFAKKLPGFFSRQRWESRHKKVTFEGRDSLIKLLPLPRWQSLNELFQLTVNTPGRHGIPMGDSLQRPCVDIFVLFL